MVNKKICGPLEICKTFQTTAPLLYITLSLIVHIPIVISLWWWCRLLLTIFVCEKKSEGLLTNSHEIWYKLHKILANRTWLRYYDAHSIDMTSDDEVHELISLICKCRSLSKKNLSDVENFKMSSRTMVGKKIEISILACLPVHWISMNRKRWTVEFNRSNEHISHNLDSMACLECAGRAHQMRLKL